MHAIKSCDFLAVATEAPLYCTVSFVSLRLFLLLSGQLVLRLEVLPLVPVKNRVVGAAGRMTRTVGSGDRHTSMEDWQ